MSTFRTIELSDPRFERDSLRHITVKSAGLHGRADITLYLPPGAENTRHLPIAILLHGVYGSHWAWALRGGAHHTAGRLIRSGQVPPLLLAMPSDGLWGDGSGYVAHTHQDFENWIVSEVPQAVQEATPLASPRSPLFISGLSMGGYGALRLGAKYGERFRGISAHSAITRWEEMAGFAEEDISKVPVPQGEKAVIDLMLANRERLPPLRFDCGREDPLLAGNRLLHRQLAKAGILHHYEEFAGGHEWEYWEIHLTETLLFFGEIFRRRGAD